MALADIQVFVRGSDYKLRGLVDDYSKLTLVQRFNASGSFVMEISGASAKAPLLDPRTGSANPGAGLVIMRNGVVLMSGPILGYGAKWDREGLASGNITVSGKDDNAWLDHRLVWPVPANAINLQGAVQFYVVSGASTPMETLAINLANLNAGPGALVARRVPGLTMATTAGRGTATSYRGKFRFDTVADAVTEILRASPPGSPSPLPRGGLGWRVAYVPGTTPGLQFQVYSTTDRVSTAKFSLDLGNLDSADYEVVAPETTNAILGAGRTATFTNGPFVAANLVGYSRTDALFPIYNETFVDVGEIDPAATDFTTQLDNAADEHFDAASGQISLEIKPISTDALQFGRDYFLGDTVQVAVPGLTFTEQIREVDLTYGSDDNEQIGLVIGTAEGYRRRTPGLYRRYTDLKKLIKKVEVRK
jgi:hypothetical protein